MLPIPTPQLDLMLDHGLTSSSTVASPGVVVSHANEASGSERVLCWEDVAPADGDALLADATAGVDGTVLQGSTIDGELALQHARRVHAPAWLDVPPLA